VEFAFGDHMLDVDRRVSGAILPSPPACGGEREGTHSVSDGEGEAGYSAALTSSSCTSPQPSPPLGAGRENGWNPRGPKARVGAAKEERR